MNKALMARKTLVGILLVLVLFIAGCGGFGADRAVACAEGSNCKYYTGTRGVDILLDRPPHMLYYRSADANITDGNAVPINVRVHNRGASDSYGGVFLSGFGPTFKVDRIYDDGTRLPISVTGLGDNCGINLGSFGPVPYFTVQCYGFDVTSSGGTYRGTLDTNKISDAFGIDWLPEDLRLNFQYTDGHFGFNVAYDGFTLNALYHGKLLMSIVVSFLDFESLNGMTYALHGDNPDYPGGGDDYKQFLVAMTGSWPSGIDEIVQPYRVTNCYAYTTFVSPQICVDPNPFSGDRGVCRANQDLSLGSQGAPVAVTRVSQRNTGRSVIMDFEVRNVGGGRVWEVGSLERCSPYFPETPTGRNHHDVIYVGFVMIDDWFIDCSQRIIRLHDGVGRFTCTYNFAERGVIGSAYVTPLRMELWYGYETTVNNNLRIRRIA